MTGTVHVTRIITGPDGDAHTERHSHPWPGHTAADITRQERFRACHGGRAKKTTRYIGEGVTVTEHVTVTDDEDQP